MSIDCKALAADLERILKLRAIPFGMKLFESKAEMEAIPKIRRPKGSVHTLDQIVAQAARLGWTVGVTAEDVAIEFGGFSDLAASVRTQVALLREHQLLRRVPVHGLVFDVLTGRLHEVA